MHTPDSRSSPLLRLGGFANYHTHSMDYQGGSIRSFFDDSNVCATTRNLPVGPYFIVVANDIASAHESKCSFAPRARRSPAPEARGLLVRASAQPETPAGAH
jgi:hypothetical protein